VEERQKETEREKLGNCCQCLVRSFNSSTKQSLPEPNYTNVPFTFTADVLGN